MSDILIETRRLTDLLKRTEETGLNAYEIGQRSKRIKELKSYEEINGKKYSKFDEYCNEELGKSEATILEYIKIFNAFAKPEEVTTMLVTHLRELVKIKDKKVRTTAVKIFKQQKKKAVFSEEAPNHSPFSTKEIKAVVELLQDEGKITEDEVEKTIQVVIETKQKEENRKFYNRFGEFFQEIKFEYIKKTISREPIDEQGTVALFCLLFSELIKYEFDFLIWGRKKKIQFHQIDFVREKFPDSRIIAKNNSSNKPELLELMVEFEYQSSNYISPHNHIISNEDCHLIICWENNINRENYSENQNQKIPPIISLSHFLYTGDILLQ